VTGPRGPHQEPKWIRFDSTGASDSGKTETWRVSTLDGTPLGRVAWFGRWRRYAFFPFDATVFEPQCLRDLAAFCEERTMAHRRAKVTA